MKKNFIKTAFLVFFALGLSWAFVNRYHYFLWATFNETFTRWDFALPLSGKEFIVRNESGGNLPRAMERIIAFAFPEHTIVYQKDAPSAHLIVTGYYGQPQEAINQQTLKAPYFAYSIENQNLRWRRYRATGYPFAEFVTRKMQTDNFIFLPFFIYAYPSLKDILVRTMEYRGKGTSRSKGVAYVYSDCTSEREGIFHSLQKKLGEDQAIGLGRCSRTPGYAAPGGYGDLDALLKDYNFVMAIENRNYKGYVTEKIINAYKAGAIPIFWGDSETVREFFNPDSFVDANQYTSFEELAESVASLSQNQEELQKKMRSPLFKDNKIPSFLLINEETLTPESEKILKEMGQAFRRLYDNYLEKKRNLSPYWKALDFSYESIS